MSLVSVVVVGPAKPISVLVLVMTLQRLMRVWTVEYFVSYNERQFMFF